MITVPGSVLADSEWEVIHPPGRCIILQVNVETSYKLILRTSTCTVCLKL